jgi:protein phosphatase
MSQDSRPASSQISGKVSLGGALSIGFSEVCDRGKVREENQDNALHATVPLGQLFVVADGIGGYQGGATASRMVTEGFSGHLASRPVGYPPDLALQEACTFTNASILQASSSGDPAFQKMGSTVVLALIQPSGAAGAHAWIGHVGDSRGYLIRNGQMMKVTTDHSAVQALLSRNLITEEEARNHPDSSVLTRSLGHRAEVEIEIDEVQLQPGDGLLLCSDGLWGYVEDADIAAVAANADLSVENIGQTLLQLALAAGGQDNIGIEFLRLEGGAASVLTTSRFTAAPSLVASEPESSQSGAKNVRTMQFAAVGLLLLAGAGCLGYLAMHNWSFSRSSQSSTSPDSIITSASSGRDDRQVPRSGNDGGGRMVAPHEKKKVGVIGDLPSMDVAVEPQPGVPKWDSFPIQNPTCSKYAKDRSVIFSQTQAEWHEALDQHPKIKERLPDIDWKKITEAVRKDCGGADVVVILVKKTPGSPADGPSATPARDAQDSLPKTPTTE